MSGSHLGVAVASHRASGSRTPVSERGSSSTPGTSPGAVCSMPPSCSSRCACSVVQLEQLARTLAANPNPNPNPNHSCGSIVGELPEARQAKGPTWAKPGMRQDTPNLDDGILTNGNVLLEARRASPGPSPNPTTLQPEP